MRTFFLSSWAEANYSNRNVDVQILSDTTIIRIFGHFCLISDSCLSHSTRVGEEIDWTWSDERSYDNLTSDSGTEKYLIDFWENDLKASWGMRMHHMRENWNFSRNKLILTTTKNRKEWNNLGKGLFIIIKRL